MFWRSAVAACLMGAAGVTGSSAQERVSVVGCPAAGVEMNCLVLQGKDNVAYDISAAKPRPGVGDRAVRLSGTKSNKVGICQQGIILEDIQWSYTEEKCD